MTGSHQAYQAFLSVLDTGSVSAASRAMGVPRPTVSRRLAQLEQHLGVRLVHRGARKVVVTREGEALARRVRPLFETLREVEQELGQRDAQPRGLLRVSLSPLVSRLLAPTMFSFRTRFPQVQLEVFVDGRYVDLRAERFDVAIRGGGQPSSDLIQRQLLRTEVLAVASPTYLQSRGTPESPTDLLSHECLRGYGPDGRAREAWPLRRGGWTPVSGDLVTNDRSLLLDAACHSQGIALLTAVTARSALQSGAVVPVLPQLVGANIRLSVVYAERAYLAPRVRSFVEMVVAATREGALDKG